MKRFMVVGVFLSVYLVAGAAQAVHIVNPVDVIWDGGDGAWNSMNWNTEQTANDVFLREYGLRIGVGEIGTDIFINSGNVTFDPNANGDLRFRDNTDSTEGSLSISGGASLSVNSNSDTDGKWTQFNIGALNLDNATFRRTFSGTSNSGGVFSFGGIRGHDNMDIKVNLSNGARIENDGQLTFGWYLANEINRKVTMTINDGDLDLTGGDNVDIVNGALGGTFTGVGNADLQFHIGWDNDLDVASTDEYAINFTGSGSITVDSAGIIVVVQTGIDAFDASTLSTLVTYEDLWDLGILQANGLSGTDGETFGDFFSITGSSGSNDYVLTSLVVTGDYNGNGIVDAADYTVWRDGDSPDSSQTGYDVWKANFGNTSGTGSGSGTALAPVPEPTTALLALLAAWGGFSFRRSRRF